MKSQRPGRNQPGGVSVLRLERLPQPARLAPHAAVEMATAAVQAARVEVPKQADAVWRQRQLLERLRRAVPGRHRQRTVTVALVEPFAVDERFGAADSSTTCAPKPRHSKIALQIQLDSTAVWCSVEPMVELSVPR